MPSLRRLRTTSNSVWTSLGCKEAVGSSITISRSIERDRSCDLEQLPVRERQRPGGSVQGKRHAQTIQFGTCSLPHDVPSNDPEAPGRKLAEHDVLGYRQILSNLSFLVDDPDPRLYRLAGTMDTYFGAVKVDRTLIGTQGAGGDLD